MTPLLLILAAVATSSAGVDPPSKHRGRTLENRHQFSPRMDYEEWTPLGRGDPLKNDPTYDYVPPVLETVHYWMDPRKRTPDPPLPKSGVMVLGSGTDTPTTTASATSRLGSMSLLDPFIKFMESSKANLFSSTVSSYFRPTPNPAPYPPSIGHPAPSYGVPSSSYPTIFAPTSSSYGPAQNDQPEDMVPPPPPKSHPLQRPPYTMLMPPPPPLPATSTETSFTSFATIIGTTSESEEIPSTTLLTPCSPLPLTTASTSEATTTVTSETTILGSSENLYKPVAINMPELMRNETNSDLSVSFFLPTPHPETLPIEAMFNGNANHLSYDDIKLPSFSMKPPPKKTGSFYFRPTTLPPLTTARTLTTDPMFKHYKQPSELMRGPFYLIIQGHSKVKTYGASKNKVKPVSSNEINFEDGKSRDDYDLESEESHRRERKLKYDVIHENNAEIVEGHPIVELSSSFQTNGKTSFGVSENAFGQGFAKSPGSDSEEIVLGSGQTEEGSFPRRKLLASTNKRTKKPTSQPLDEQQLNLESFIALNEDYNSDDIVNLLLKGEGEGSGVGNFVSSIFAKSLSHPSEEM